MVIEKSRQKCKPRADILDQLLDQPCDSCLSRRKPDWGCSGRSRGEVELNSGQRVAKSTKIKNVGF